MNKAKILIIEDEPSILKFLRHSLQANGYETIDAANGSEGIQRAIEKRPNLIILDYGLPDLTGLDVLRKVREWSKIPILFLTVRDSDEDKVAALDAGADDYLTKPFSVPELLARVRVGLRHSVDAQDVPVLKMGLLEIDRSAHVVRVGGREVKLTLTEYSLLALLARYPGRVVPHRIILNEVWGPNSIEHNHYLRVYFAQIRRKFEAAVVGSSELIITESGVGYRLQTPTKNEVS